MLAARAPAAPAATRCSENTAYFALERELPKRAVGRTPWSARVPLDPLFAQLNQPHAIPERPTGGSAADQGVRPTIKRHWI
jgi:hypothetical protein